MSRIPPPEPGQPLDVSYISQIVKAVNDLSVQLSPTTNKNFLVDTVGQQANGTRTSEMKVIGHYVEVVTSANQAIGSQQPFGWSFPAEFKFTPLVVATPINVGQTDAGKNVSVVLKTVSTSRVDGIVNFNANGNVTIGVNLLIVGIPN